VVGHKAPWKIAAEKPTLLLDEVDVISKDRKGDAQAAMRGIINAGNQRVASIPRAETSVGS
jgi:ATP-dependent Lon protease